MKVMIIVMALIIGAALSGCANMSRGERGMLAGGAVGGVVGGAVSGGSGWGVGAGALGGALIGNAVAR